MQNLEFDGLLARELACAFASATRLGCTVTCAPGGDTLCRFGYTCLSCELCARAGRDEAACARAHQYGMAEAQRFGGRYVYFCGRGLNFFVSPIIGREAGCARVTVGPFLMVDADDYLACELNGDMSLMPYVERVPRVKPDEVSKFSTLLYMAVGYLNNVSDAEAMREKRASDYIQGQISAYILELKSHEAPPVYPYDKERALLRAMLGGERPEANRLLNELLGHILVNSGAAFSQIKAQINALLVMMTRTVLAQSGDPGKLEKRVTDDYLALEAQSDMEKLCMWLTSTMNELMAYVFEYRDARHADAIHRCIQFIRTHLDDKLELETLARAACLSPSYFSRVFKEETGKTVMQAIMEARLQKAAELIRYENLRLTDIAPMVGFQDQSYFSRAFQKAYGMPPSEYRKRAPIKRA